MGLLKQLTVKDGLLVTKGAFWSLGKQRARGGGRGRERHTETKGAKKPCSDHFLDFSAEQPPLLLLRESVLPSLEPVLLRILLISLGRFCFSSFSVSRW